MAGAGRLWNRAIGLERSDGLRTWETAMTDENAGEGLYIDSDWKEEAAKEKERLAEQERREPAAGPPPGGSAPLAFIELVNTLAMQAAIALGGLQGPNGERIPPNPAAARHAIDLLEVLDKKTEGNLTDDEKRVLAGVLYELRMQYVQVVSGPAPSAEQKGGDEA